MTVQLETIKDYIEANIKVSLKKKIRTRDMAYARAVYYKLAKRYTVQSLTSIGNLVHLQMYQDSVATNSTWQRLRKKGT